MDDLGGNSEGIQQIPENKGKRDVRVVGRCRRGLWVRRVVGRDFRVCSAILAVVRDFWVWSILTFGSCVEEEGENGRVELAAGLFGVCWN
ncbi:hypothetical protein KY285_026719 [Solanum tuberosum]|nr:hypothetical protein KY284_026756 [Solanum tuberosum]KAH0665513.1 hypothetical protein KY285_026719 [Solanum tuberosum]